MEKMPLSLISPEEGATQLLELTSNNFQRAATFNTTTVRCRNLRQYGGPRFVDSSLNFTVSCQCVFQ